MSINREFGVEKCEGGPRKWEAQAVCYENGQHFVFSHSFFLHPLTPVTPRLLLHPGCYHHHLSHIQIQAGGDYCCCFDLTPTTTTTLVSKQAEGGFFCSFDLTPTTTTTLRSKCEPEVVLTSYSLNQLLTSLDQSYLVLLRFLALK